MCSDRTGVLYRRTPMPKCSCFTTLLKLHFGMGVCSPVNLLHIFRTPFPKNISGWLLLYWAAICQSTYGNIIETDVYQNESQFIVILVVCIVLLLFNYDCYAISSIIVWRNLCISVCFWKRSCEFGLTFYE